MKPPLSRAQISAAARARKDLHFSCDDPDRFARVISLDSVLRTLFSARLPVTALDFCRGFRPAGAPSREMLARILRDMRAPICIRDLQRHSRPVEAFAKTFSRQAGCPVRIDCFLMPAGRKGELTQWHWDPMDKFLLQVEGEITYLIYEVAVKRSARRGMRGIREQDCVLAREIRTRKGEICYIPKGVPHRHKLSTNAESVHAPVWLLAKAGER